MSAAAGDDRTEDGGGEATADLDRALAALWRISMTAETASVDDPPWLLPNQIRHLADIGMGKHRRRAQELAAEERAPAARPGVGT